jgi:hypothetical protein
MTMDKLGLIVGVIIVLCLMIAFPIFFYISLALLGLGLIGNAID